MATPDRDDRVAIWNTFFKLAWSEAKAVFETAGHPANDSFTATPNLTDEQHHVVAAVLLCNLAIEARANHLIEDLVEQGKITEEVGRAAQRLPTKHRWFLIPSLAGLSAKVSSSEGPHQAVAQLCDLRNDFVHVNYGGLHAKLPSRAQLLSYYGRFVEALENMNVLLGKGGRTAPKPEVLRLGSFHSK